MENFDSEIARVKDALFYDMAQTQHGDVNPERSQSLVMVASQIMTVLQVQIGLELTKNLPRV